MQLNKVEPLRIKLKDLIVEDTLKKMYVIVSKTPSFFNRDLRDLPFIKKVVAIYLLKNPFLRELNVLVPPNFPNATFNTSTHSFVFGIFNSDIIAHEIEHAISLSGASPLYTGGIAISKFLNKATEMASLGSIPLALFAKHKGVSGIDKFLNLASIAHGVTSAPNLYEEGKASLGAIRASDRTEESLKTLAPSFGSYVAGAVLPIIVNQLSKKLL